MKLKALLIIPSQKWVYGADIGPSYPPLGILYIAGTMEQVGVDVKVLDIDADKIPADKLVTSISNFRPDLIGITATTPTIKGAFGLSDLIKRHYEIPIVLGGIHPTMNAAECIRHPSIDFVVKGEGEDIIKELVIELIQGKRDFSKIKGLLWKDGGRFIFNGERELIGELDRIPFPARHLLKNFSAYKPPDAEHLPVASIMTTRGCPGRCTYCCTQNIFKDKYRMRGIDNVLGEIDEIIRAFKVKEIHIADDAFNANRERALNLCEAIRKRDLGINFEFLNGLRADVIDEQILDAFKSIGIRNVGFGVENADESILKNVKKNISPEKVRRAIALSKKKGFKTWLFFMLGLPGETQATIKKTIAFANETDPDFAKFLIFKPYPGSVIYDEIKEKGLIDDLDFNNYGIYTPPVHRLEDLTKSDLLYWQKKAFRQFYFRPKKIWDHIKRQRSLSQLKLSMRGLSFVCFNALKMEKSRVGT